MLIWIFAGICAILILVISRKSITTPGSHGFWRFFAWEAMLILIAFNLRKWFHNPFSWNQILSWVLLVACLIPLIFGMLSLINKGKASKARIGETDLLAFEKTTALVNTGIYKYIRHPLYSSLLLLTWGTFFKQPLLFQCILAIIASVFIFLTALADEKECTRYFGEHYTQYMQQTKRFIPFVL